MSRAKVSEYDSVLSGSSSDCIFCTSSLVIALFRVGFQNLPMLYCLNGLSVSAKTFCLTALLYTARSTLNEVARLLLLLPFRVMYASKSCRNCKSTCSNRFFPRLHCSKRLLQVSYLDAVPTLPIPFRYSIC